MSNQNLLTYVDEPYIHVIGGGWLYNSADIKAQNYSAITSTVKEKVSKSKVITAYCKDQIDGFTVYLLQK